MRSQIDKVTATYYVQWLISTAYSDEQIKVCCFNTVFILLRDHDRRIIRSFSGLNGQKN